jgi:murein DD-endopeptidase MepM/ murein hydrolase activator NlpD
MKLSKTTSLLGILRSLFVALAALLLVSVGGAGVTGCAAETADSANDDDDEDDPDLMWDEGPLEPEPESVGEVSSAASARPAFRFPLTCGYSWTGSTRTGHSPRLAIDFSRANATGWLVRASAGGTVSVVQNLGGRSYGRWIEINHGGGWRTRYAHLSSQSVRVGQKVSKGQVIGKVGSTGNSTGPHLHYEQRRDGVAASVVLGGRQVFYYGRRTYRC